MIKKKKRQSQVAEMRQLSSVWLKKLAERSLILQHRDAWLWKKTLLNVQSIPSSVGWFFVSPGSQPLVNRCCNHVIFFLLLPLSLMGPHQLIAADLSISRLRRLSAHHCPAPVFDSPLEGSKFYFLPLFHRRVPVLSSPLAEERITAASLKHRPYWNPFINSPSPSNFSVVLPSGKIR